MEPVPHAQSVAKSRISGGHVNTSGDFQFDEIGRWSELKLEIVEKYGAAYTTAFAGPKGRNLKKTTSMPSAELEFIYRKKRDGRSRAAQRAP